jgi:ABC-type hemin transport system ATPase subunit
VLDFLPPYCPDHNKTERVWLDPHAIVTRKHRCRRMSDLMANVLAFLHDLNRGLRMATRLMRVATPRILLREVGSTSFRGSR